MQTCDKAKAAGLKSLTEMAKILKLCTQTLRNRDKNNPKLFEADLKRAVGTKLKMMERLL